MPQPVYTLPWILPFVRQSLQGRGNFSYDNFVWGVWSELEKVGIPGVSRIPYERNYSNQLYDYAQAPHELRSVTTEAFYYLFTMASQCLSLLRTYRVIPFRTLII